MAMSRATGGEAHVALLRGINVGGKNKLPMKVLVDVFQRAGAADVQTYIQSGNVVYRAPPALSRRLPGLIRTALADELGLEVPVITRTARELVAVVQKNPFLRARAAARAEPSTLHVAFLADVPTAARAASLDVTRSPPDELVLLGREIFLRCPNGMGRSKLTTAYFDSTLSTVSTLRNWRTVLALESLVAE